MSDSQKNELIRELAIFSEAESEHIVDTLAQQQYAYAVIEQSMFSDFMPQLYAMASDALTWDYLFRPDRDEGLRQAGPVLIALNDEALTLWFVSLLTQQSGGCLLRSTTDFDETLLWAQARMTLISPEGAQAICRFFDPKNMAFMLASQTASQQQAFWHQTLELYWFDAGQWWSYQSIPMPQPLIESYQLSQTELDGISQYKLALNKRKLLQYYQGSATKDNTSIAQLAELAFHHGQQYGATTVKDYDAWLRLSIIHGQGFYQSAFAKAQLDNTKYPLHKNLALIKRQLESVS